MSPEQFWGIGLTDFLDMANAVFEEDEAEWDREYSRTAWQTSLLMNATGNYKKTIKPDDLFESQTAKQSATKKNSEYVKSEQEKLIKMFQVED